MSRPFYGNEQTFLRQVINLAKLNGWKTAHFGASVKVVGKDRHFVGDKDSAGFPDIVAVKSGRVLYAELKVGKNKPSPNQQAWMGALADAGEEMYLWYPSDWDEIVAVFTT